MADRSEKNVKIKTMFEVVKPMEITIEGVVCQKKALYLTNEEVDLIDGETMQKLIRRLELGEPKFVIYLLPSMGFIQYRKVHTELKNKAEEFLTRQKPYLPTEFYPIDESTNQILLIDLMTTILDIATRNKAVVLINGANDCSLSEAFSIAAFPIQSKYKPGECPFKIVSIANEYEIHYNATNEKGIGTVSQLILSYLSDWNDRLPYLNNTPFLSDKDKLQRCDLIKVADCYLIIESLDKAGKPNNSSQQHFQSRFFHSLSKKLPCVAIQAFKSDMGISHLRDLANENLPVLFIDSYERAVTSGKPSRDSKGKIIFKTLLAKEYPAFPDFNKKEILSLEHESYGNLTRESRRKILEKCKDMIRELQIFQESYLIIDEYDSALIAFFKAALQLGCKKNWHNGETLGEQIKIYEERQRHDLEMKESEDLEFAADIAKFIVTEVNAKNILNLSKRIEELHVLNSNEEPKRTDVQTTCDNRDKRLSDFGPDSFGYGFSKGENVSKIEEQFVAFSRRRKLIEANDNKLTMFDQEKYSALVEIFGRRNVYSGSLHNLEKLKQTLKRISRIDRLPEITSLEALKALQEAWDTVELYHYHARIYKWITVISYIVLLLLSISITILSVVSANKQTQKQSFSQLPVIILGFVTVALISYVSFLNPILRWQQLRVAALNIEGNIFMFRTRAGPYRSPIDDINDDYADNMFKQTLRELKNEVIEGGDVKETTIFMNIFQRNKHDQHYYDPDVKEAFERINRNWIKDLLSLLCSPLKNIIISIWHYLLHPLLDIFKCLCCPFYRQNLKGLYEYEEDKIRSNIIRQKNIRRYVDLHEQQANLNGNFISQTEDPKEKSEIKAIDNDSLTNSNEYAVSAAKDPSEEKSDRMEGRSVGVSLVASRLGKNGNLKDYIFSCLPKINENEFEKQPTKSNENKKWPVFIKEDLKGKRKLGLDELIVEEKFPDNLCNDPLIWDYHHEPMSASLYIKFRIYKAIDFYNDRIPKCHFIRNASKAIVVCGSILMGALAVFNLVSWAAIDTIIVASIAAFLEFHDTDNKLRRYNITLTSLLTLIEWWEQLPEIEQSSTANIDILVTTCEDVIQKEYGAWKASTSQMIKVLAKEIQDAGPRFGSSNSSSTKEFNTQDDAVGIRKRKSNVNTASQPFPSNDDSNYAEGSGHDDGDGDLAEDVGMSRV